MSFEITIRVDGESEQKLAPVLSQMAARSTELVGNSPPQPFFHENTARLQQTLLQQQVQQLMAQNEQLKAQAAGQLVGRAALQALPPADSRRNQQSAAAGIKDIAAAESGSSTMRPRLPAQYQSEIKKSLFHALSCMARRPIKRIWQGLVWIAFGKEGLAVVLLLGAGLYGALKVAPILSSHLPHQLSIPTWLRTRIEFTAEPFEEGPGQTVPAQEDLQSEPAGGEADQSSAADTGLPLPAALNDHHPPPPPAFQDNQVEYQER